MTSKRVLIVLTAVALLAFGAFIGWGILGSGTIDADTLEVITAGAIIATAIGTIGLAIATYALAQETRDVVNVSRQQAGHAEEGLAIARQQTDTGRAALDAQTQPFFAKGSVDPAVLNADSAHFRNFGNATGLVTQVVFVAPDGERYSGAAVEPAVPPTESTAVTRSPRTLEAEKFGSADNFSVVALFADVSGRLRGAVRLDVYRKASDPRATGVYQQRPSWWVRQVHWAADIDSVIADPDLSSQPYDPE